MASEEKQSGMVLTHTARILLVGLAAGLIWNPWRGPYDLGMGSLRRQGGDEDDEVRKLYADLFQTKLNGTLPPTPAPTIQKFNKIGNIITTEETNKVCLMVRTYPKQANTLRVLLHGILDAASTVLVDDHFTHPSLSVQVILADTDPGTLHQPPQFLYDILRDMDTTMMNSNNNNNNNNFNVQMEVDTLDHYNKERDCVTENGQPDYGYCITQYLFDQHILQQKSNCDWVLFTNGDNFLSKYIFQQTQLHSRSLNTSPDMILFDFVTNHGRPSRDGTSRKNQPIQTLAQANYVDLSSVFFQTKAIRNCPTATFKPYRFAEDWYFVERMKGMCRATIEIIPEILLVHQ